MRRERGFILVEIVTILLIVGTLVNIFLPNYIAIKKKAEAARVIGDYLVVRDAVTMYHSHFGRWPGGSAWAKAPAGLGMFIPAGFSWDLRPDIDVRYSWEYLPVNTEDAESGGAIAGLSVFSNDDALIRAISGTFRGHMILARGFEGTKRIILIVRMAGRMRDGQQET
jgi:type II secretory pathway pseudopilin PulG